MRASTSPPTVGLPSFVPAALVRARPAFTRSWIIDRSNSANTPIIWNIARPAGVRLAFGRNGVEEGADAALKKVEVHPFAVLGDPHVLLRGLVGAPAVRLDPRLELSVPDRPLSAEQRLAGPLRFHQHRLAVELHLPVGVVDLAGEEREVDDEFNGCGHGEGLTWGCW